VTRHLVLSACYGVRTTEPRCLTIIIIIIMNINIFKVAWTMKLLLGPHRLRCMPPSITVTNCCYLLASSVVL